VRWLVPGLLLLLLLLPPGLLLLLLFMGNAARIGFGLHFARGLGQKACVMFGVLLKILGRDTIVRKLGIACKHLILFDDLLGRAAHLAFGTGTVKDPIGDIAQGSGAVLLGTRALFG
jgi:hypothetical protein